MRWFDSRDKDVGDCYAEQGVVLESMCVESNTESEAMVEYMYRARTGSLLSKRSYCLRCVLIVEP